MNNRLIFGLLLVIGFTAIGGSGQQSITLEELRKMKKKSSPVQPTNPVKTGPSKKDGSRAELIADGSFAKVKVPFVFVARDRTTYQMLASMIDGFENDQSIDFDKQAVVAAFSGAKETGGYSVSIKLTDGKCTIEDVAPAHGAIVTEAITHPFAVALVPVEEQDPFEVVAGEMWTRNTELFEVTSGSFEFTGGFVGITRKFDVDGTIGVLKSGKYITVFFKLSEIADEPARTLFETASGLLDPKKPEIIRLEAGNLIDRPHPPFKIDAIFAGDKVEMRFLAGERDYIVNDGFEGKGILTAVKAQ